MNPELRALLGRLALPGAGEPDLWRRTVMLKNYGSIPMGPGQTADSATLGFLLLFLDEHGKPAHYAKCRPLEDDGFRRECRVIDGLHEDPVVGEYVLQARTGRSVHLRAHVSRHLEVPRLDRQMQDRTPERWKRTTRQVVGAASAVCVRAGEVLPDLAPDEATLLLDEEGRSRMPALLEAGVDREVLDRLVDELAGVTVPPVTQHGDLWPGNVFWRSDGTGRLVDLERLGVVEVPLFDAFHMLWSSARIRGDAGGGPWIPFHEPGPTRRRDSWREAAREVVWAEAERLPLDREQVGGALVFAVLEMAAHRCRAGAPDWFRDPLLRDLERLSGWLSDGSRLSDLLPPPGRSSAPIPMEENLRAFSRV